MKTKGIVTTMKKIDSMLIAAKNTLANKSAETYVDTGVKILIAVVVGAMVLAGLIYLFDKTILPQATEKVQGLFDETATLPAPGYQGVVATP